MKLTELARIIRAQFALDYHGMHGAAHWGRVRENGLRLAALTGAKPKVVELFALLHDSRRLNDGDDPEHGTRAAVYAQTLAKTAFKLAPEDLADLATACRFHSQGLMTGKVTVLTCYDADRLDLGRVGCRPDPKRLCTPAARDPALIAWAYQRSTAPAAG